MAETTEETPSPERVLAGDSFHYDAEGNARTLCVRCMQPIDLEFGDYVELGMTEKRGLGMERVGARWYVCGGCADQTGQPDQQSPLRSVPVFP